MKRKGKKRPTSPETPRQGQSAHWALAGILLYIAVVLVVDTLAATRATWPFAWSFFQWPLDMLWRMFLLQPPAWSRSTVADGIDLFKLIFWFLIPLLFCARSLEWGWFMPRGWKRVDWAVLGALVLVGGVAVFSVSYIPALQRTYPGLSHLPWPLRRDYGIAQLLWVATWLPGWTFIHRYWLVRAASRPFPMYGWLLVPLSEGLYHLQKPGIEALGMVLFSIILTWWALKRRNLLLPFLAHLYIEVMLIIALVFFL